MNCKNCGAKLARISKFCPECGAKIDLPEAPKQNSDTSTIEGVMSDLVNQFGKDVYKKDNAKKLKNLLCDLAVKFPRELKLLTRVVPEGLQEILLNADNGSEDEKQSAVIAFQKQLVENAFLSDQVAAEAANILTVGLGWKIKLAVNTAQQVNTSQSVSQAVVQNAAPVHKDQSNTESKYSDSYLNSLSAGELSVLESKTHDAKVEFEIAKRFEAKNLLQKAQVWYQKAAAKGYEKAQKKLSSMNPVQASASVQTSVSVQSNQTSMEKELTDEYLASLSFNEITSFESRTHNAKVQNWIGLCYDSGASKYGKDFSKNDNKACEWYQKAAEQGYVSAQCNLGYMYEVGHGVPQNYEKACEWYQKAAEQGNARAQCNLGYMYDVGNGVPQNYEKACEWYQKAANQGYIRAQFNLARMYVNGSGVPQNFEKACEWYQKAAEQGHARAQFNLARKYDSGSGVPQNFEKACEWYQKAAEQGFVEAQHELGFKYRVGQGCAKNLQKAIDYYEKAAAQGDIDCFYALGLLYEHDLKNYAKAREWYRKLADQGDYRGLQLLERIKGK